MLKHLLVTCMIALPLTANSALESRLGGLAYYDTDADLTWLADANYAQTSGYDTDGRMTWVNANAWATSLTIGGISGWRLVDTDPSCGFGSPSSGFTCTGSEMLNLYTNVLGNSDYVISNTGPFSNVQYDLYWSATVFAPHAPDLAFAFDMLHGYQDIHGLDSGFYGWAVQSGDVSAVPLPAAVWLFGSGLIGLIGVARRKKA